MSARTPSLGREGTSFRRGEAKGEPGGPGLARSTSPWFNGEGEKKQSIETRWVAH